MPRVYAPYPPDPGFPSTLLVFGTFTSSAPQMILLPQFPIEITHTHTHALARTHSAALALNTWTLLCH